MKRLQAVLFAFILLSGIFFSCSDDSTNPPDVKDELIDVEWTSNTVVFDQDELNEVIKIDTTDFTVTFSKGGKAAGLKQGDIIFIYGKLLRKVVSVDNSGGNIIVTTEHANLNEAVKNGRIQWNKEITFTPDNIPSIQMKNGKDLPLTIQGDDFEAEMEINGYKIGIKMSTKTDSAEITLSAEKGVGANLTAKYEFKGSIYKFKTQSTIDYADSKLKNFDYSNQGTAGDLTVTLTCIAGQNELKGAFELPVIIYQVPFIVGGIPVILKLKILLLVNTKLSSPEASARVQAKFTYNSNTGIKFDGVEASANGSIGKHSIEKIIAQTGGTISLAANFGFGFPRLELSIFNDVIVPWVHTAFLLEGEYIHGTHPCQKAQASYIGACGFNFEFLGIKLSGSKTLWQEDKVLLKAGDCE